MAPSVRTPSRQPLSHLHDIQVRSCHNNTSICDVCCWAKHKYFVFPSSDSRALAGSDLMHSDIWGPYWCSTISGAKYVLSIIDYFSCIVWVYLMHDKG